MQNQVTVFRTLIVSSLVLSLVGGFIDLVFPGLVPESLAKAYEAYTEAEAPMSVIIVAGVLSVVVMLLAIVATVGLLLLQSWARSLALWSTALSVLIYPLLGALLQSGVSAALLTISVALWGAALAMTFYSDLKSRFQRPAS
jgi:urea transporter